MSVGVCVFVCAVVFVRARRCCKHAQRKSRDVLCDTYATAAVPLLCLPVSLSLYPPLKLPLFVIVTFQFGQCEGARETEERERGRARERDSEYTAVAAA